MMARARRPPSVAALDSRGENLDVAPPRYINFLVIALILSACLYRLLLITNGWPGFESDQAIIGLMGRHIWLAGERPVFFYGQLYMGPVEAYMAVPFFALFGSSVFTLRLAMIPLTALFLLAIYALGRITYGTAAAVSALAWLAMGPSVAVYREVLTVGGKPEMLVLASVILLSAWARLKMPERYPQNPGGWARCLATYAVLGAAIGIGVWSDVLITPLALATLIALVIARPREVLSWPALVLTLSGVFAAWPFLQFNLTHSFATLDQALYFSDHGDGSLMSAVANLTSLDLPALFGSPRVCVPSAKDLVPYTWITQLSQPATLCGLGNVAFSLVIIAVYGGAALLLIKTAWTRGAHVRRSRQFSSWRPSLSPAVMAQLWLTLGAPLSPDAARHSARLWLRGIMVASVFVWLIAFVKNPADLEFPLGSSRYLVPMYLSAPLLFGTLWDAVRPGLARLSRQQIAFPTPNARAVFVEPFSARISSRGTITAALAVVTIVVLFTFSIADGFLMASDSNDIAQYRTPEVAWHARILDFFALHNIHTYYTDDYYTCYTFAFESNERQICAVLGSDGQPSQATSLNRYLPYVSAVATDQNHAYLLGASQSEEFKFQHGNLPSQGYQRVVIEGFAIYYRNDP